jgi:hypothetical protein
MNQRWKKRRNILRRIRMKEIDLQNKIRIGLNDIAITFRGNVGLFYTKTGRPIRTGLPPGFSDLFGFRRLDNKMFFIEVKTRTGRLSKDQKNFLKKMSELGCITGVARSVDDAREIIENGWNGSGDNETC